MKPFNYAFISIVILLLIASFIGVFYIGGLTPKLIFFVFIAVALSFTINKIYNNLLMKRNR